MELRYYCLVRVLEGREQTTAPGHVEIHCGERGRRYCPSSRFVEVLCGKVGARIRTVLCFPIRTEHWLSQGAWGLELASGVCGLFSTITIEIA